MKSRDFGILHSFERNFLDGLWKQLGVDPLDERAALIEAKLVLATLKCIVEVKQRVAREFAEREQRKHVITPA